MYVSCWTLRCAAKTCLNSSSPRTWLRLSRRCLLSSWCVFKCETFFGGQIVVTYYVQEMHVHAAFPFLAGLIGGSGPFHIKHASGYEAVNSDSEVVLGLTRHDDPCLPTNKEGFTPFVRCCRPDLVKVGFRHPLHSLMDSQTRSCSFLRPDRHFRCTGVSSQPENYELRDGNIITVSDKCHDVTGVEGSSVAGQGQLSLRPSTSVSLAIANESTLLLAVSNSILFLCQHAPQPQWRLTFAGNSCLGEWAYERFLRTCSTLPAGAFGIES